MEPSPQALPRPRLIHTIRVRLFIITGLLLLLNVCGGLAHLLLEVRQNNVEMSTNMIERDSDTLYVYGDKDKLTQVIMYNLLSNATKYSPHGGHILIDVSAEKAQIHICVQDQGIGIPKEALEAIFHPYNRVIIKCIGKFIYRSNEKRKTFHVAAKFKHNYEKKSCFLRGREHGGKAIFIATLRKYPI